MVLFFGVFLVYIFFLIPSHMCVCNHMSFSSPQSFFLLVSAVYIFLSRSILCWSILYATPPCLIYILAIITFPSESSLIIMIIDDCCRRTHLSNAEKLWRIYAALIYTPSVMFFLYIFTATLLNGSIIYLVDIVHHRCRFSNDSYINKELNDQQQTFLSLWKNKKVYFFFPKKKTCCWNPPQDQYTV